MTDTDDTDLLLLIPPDFFLIQSPDIPDCDSDSDSFHLTHNEVQNSLVSDLISVVNDLESRVCMIETLDKSLAHCSTCNDDSINSLTESDLLRPYSCNRNIQLSTKGSKDNLMSENPHNLKEKQSDLENNVPTRQSILQTGVLNQYCKEIKSGFIDTHSPDIKPNSSSTKNSGCSPRSHRKQAKLFDEIDSFIEKRNTKSSNISKIERNFPSLNDNNVNQSLLDESSVQESISVESRSLALPDVYELLQEMEDTQKEIVEKLKFRGSLSPKIGDSSKSPTKPFGNIIKRSHTLPLVDMYSRPMSAKSEYNGPKPNSFPERLKTTEGTNDANKLSSQMSYFPPQGSSTESSRFRDFRPRNFSPNRVIPSYNPIDIVRANLPKKDTKFSITTNDESPHKSFRRHLNFEGVSLTDSTKLKHSSQEECDVTPLSEETTLPIDKSAVVSNSGRHLTKADYVPSLEEKFNHLTLQRTTEKLNLPTKLEKKSSEDLKSKLSSNNLLSLSELWNREPTFHSDDPNKLRQKLEEEKYRRQHCEQQIHVLQLKVLEDQEKLAVAMKVDQEKDNAILQITESWRQLNEHWRELEEQRHSLAQQLQEEKTLNQSKTADLAKKMDRWEKEVSQALDLAAGYKEKCENIQSQMEILKSDTEEKIDNMTTEIQRVKEENERVKNENKTLIHQLKELQDRIIEEEELLAKLKTEFEHSNQLLSEQEAEINVLKEQKDSLTCMMKEEKTRSSILEQQKITLQQTADEALKKEKAAKEEARVSSERIEVARTELRALYLGQLESVVKEKLQEFQTQLCLLVLQKAAKEEARVSSERIEVARTELRALYLGQLESVVKEKLQEFQTQLEKAAKEEARVSSERIEVARTELRALYQGQLESVVKEKLQEFQTQLEAAEAALKTELQIKERQWAEKANEQCRKLHDKLKLDKVRIEEACREEMKKLQVRLAESERLRNATENKLQEETNHRADIAHRLHSVMETQWREALDIISNPLQIRVEDHEALERVRGGGEMKVQDSESGQSLANTEDPPFCRDGQLTYRAPQPDDLQLKKYIQMLLDRGPGNPIPNESLQESFNQSMSVTSDGSALGSRWVPMPVTSSGNLKDEMYIQLGQNLKTGQSNKPPWK